MKPEYWETLRIAKPRTAAGRCISPPRIWRKLSKLKSRSRCQHYHTNQLPLERVTHSRRDVHDNLFPFSRSWGGRSAACRRATRSGWHEQRHISLQSKSTRLNLLGFCRSGDTNVRLWDLNTETPSHTLSGHKGWVLCVEWEPMERKLASGGHDGHVRDNPA